MKFANIALAQGQPCLQEGPHRVAWEEAGHEQGPHDQGGKESRQDGEEVENSHRRLSGPGQFITTSFREENILFSFLSEPCRRSYQAADGRRRATWTNQAGVGDIQPIEGRFLCQGLMKIILMVLWYVMAPFCDSPLFIFLDFWVNSDPTATGNFDCGRSSTTREGEELARGLQVNSPWDF